MKRTLTLTICMVLVICAIGLSKIYSYKEEITKIQQFNLKYEKYLDKEIIGTDIATLINQATNDNEQKIYEKINIEIKIIDFEKEKIYDMETLYSGGMEKFVQYYGQIKFKTSKKEYSKNAQITYILFEQLSS